MMKTGRSEGRKGAGGGVWEDGERKRERER